MTARRSSSSARFAVVAMLCVAAVAAACSQPAGTALPTVPALPTALPTLPPVPTGLPTIGPSVDIRVLAEEACLATQFPNCVDGLVQLAQTAPGSLAAICDYGNGTGNIVVVESEAAAEAKCAEGAAGAEVRVVGVLQLP